MKNIIYSFIILSSFFFAISCENDEDDKTKLNEVTLFFKNVKDDSDTIKITSKIKLVNNEVSLLSDEIVEFKTKDSKTNKNIKFFCLKETHENKWQIYEGWGFDGNCFIYGQFVVDDEGNSLFVPCGWRCFHQPICPPYGSNFV